MSSIVSSSSAHAHNVFIYSSFVCDGERSLNVRDCTESIRRARAPPVTRADARAHAHLTWRWQILYKRSITYVQTYQIIFNVVCAPLEHSHILDALVSRTVSTSNTALSPARCRRSRLLDAVWGIACECMCIYHMSLRTSRFHSSAAQIMSAIKCCEFDSILQAAREPFFRSHHKTSAMHDTGFSFAME